MSVHEFTWVPSEYHQFAGGLSWITWKRFLQTKYAHMKRKKGKMHLFLLVQMSRANYTTQQMLRFNSDPSWEEKIMSHQWCRLGERIHRNSSSKLMQSALWSRRMPLRFTLESRKWGDEDLHVPQCTWQEKMEFYICLTAHLQNSLFLLCSRGCKMVLPDKGLEKTRNYLRPLAQCLFCIPGFG